MGEFLNMKWTFIIFTGLIFMSSTVYRTCRLECILTDGFPFGAEAFFYFF